MTSALKQFVEWYLGAESAEPGEATTWTWRTAAWLSSVPQWVLVVFVTATVLGIVAVYRRDARALTWKRRWTLVALRLTTVGLLSVLLVQLSLAIDRVGLPHLVIMIDDSASMAFQDDYSGTSDEDFVVSVAGDAATSSRLKLSQDLLAGDSGLLAQLTGRYRLKLYRFSEQAEPQRSEDNNLRAMCDAVRELTPTGQNTAPAAAVRQVLDEFRGAPPAAIVVVTDGISTRGEENRLQSVSGAATRAAVPLYVVGIGSTKPAADLKLTDINVDEVAIVNEATLFTATLQSQGFEGREVLLELKDATTGERLAGRTVKLTGSSQPIEFTYVPPVAGEFDYQFGVQPVAEEHITENNFEIRHVSVRDGRIRVLLVESLPRYEFRYLKHLLERSEGDSGAIDLHTILFDADPEWTALDASAAELQGRMPSSSEEINNYDVIILGDVDPVLLSPTTQAGLRDFVREKGGGMVLISGANHNPHGYRGTQLEPLVPIPLETVTAADFRVETVEGTLVKPTLAGRRGTPLFRFGDSETEASRAIAGFTELYSLLTMPESAPGISVLASGDAEAQPVIISRQYGAGRVVLHGTDDLWMWRFRSGDEFYGRYWISLVRYLSRSSLLGRDRGAELVTDRETYNRGEYVGFQLRFLDSRQQPSDRKVSINIERRNGASSVLALEPSSDSPDVYTGTFAAGENGSYHAWVTKPIFENTPPSTDFRVQDTGRELLVREMDSIGMQAAARSTRGRYYSLGTSARLASDLPQGRSVAIASGAPVELWSRPELLLLIVAFLSLEWFLRKNARLV